MARRTLEGAELPMKQSATKSVEGRLRGMGHSTRHEEWGHGFVTPCLVGDAGFEPATPSV
ncbi:hypothetical protein HMPREF1275_01607 [Propionibacterium sp. KPL1844]|nr:hypothetical protein HMPREF1275_01607 [Propionibacterium sp. KPL1844]